MKAPSGKGGSRIELEPVAESVRPDLLVIAGEHSGDQHAAAMVAEYLRLSPKASVYALGGGNLEAAGARLLFDLSAHSVVGLVEVLRNYRFFSQLMQATQEWIQRYRPRAVLLVDYPGFNLRLADRLKQSGISRSGGGDVSMLYYISPQIWAWKARRRFRMAACLDALAVIFPFEQECYRDTSLAVEFVGHPFARPDFDPELEYHKNGPLLLLPGSRRAAVRRIYPTMLETLERIRATHPRLEAVTVFPGDMLKAELERMQQQHKQPVKLVSANTRLKASAVLTSSGTMSLKCALAGIPGAIVYRAHPVTFWLGKRLVKIKHLGMANLLCDDPVYPEFLQGDAQPEALACEIRRCLDEPARGDDAHHLATKLRNTLTRDTRTHTPGEWLARQLNAAAADFQLP